MLCPLLDASLALLKPGLRTDAERNCISNIRGTEGLGARKPLTASSAISPKPAVSALPASHS